MAAERYTAIFTGLLSLKKPGEYPYARMDDDPLGSGGYTVSPIKPRPSTQISRGAFYKILGRLA